MTVKRTTRRKREKRCSNVPFPRGRTSSTVTVISPNIATTQSKMCAPLVGQVRAVVLRERGGDRDRGGKGPKEGPREGGGTRLKKTALAPRARARQQELQGESNSPFCWHLPRLCSPLPLSLSPCLCLCFSALSLSLSLSLSRSLSAFLPLPLPLL